MSDASAKRLPLSLEGSLHRLQTDYIDVYLYHVPPDLREAEAAAKFLESAKRQGKVRAVGISSNSLEPIRLLHSFDVLDAVQFSRSLLIPNSELAAFLRERNVGGIARGAFAGGRLSGKYFQAPPVFAPEDVRQNWFAAGALAREFARCAVFGELVTPQRSMAQVALRYVLDEPAVHTVILGAKTLPEYQAAVQAADLPPLTAQENERVACLRDALLK